MFRSDFLFDFLNNIGYFAVPASLLISILVAVAGVLPSLFVTGANVLLFGSFYGFLISWLGEVLGAAVSFYLYRFGFRRRFEGMGSKHSLLNKIMDGEGLKAGVLIFQARLLPFVPSGFVTFAASISKVGLSTFILATAMGKIPSIALEALVSYDFINIGSNWIRLGITIIAVVIMLAVLKRK